MEKTRPLATVAFSVETEFAAPTAESAVRRFSSVAYSGDVITDHPLWDRVAFDLGSTKFSTPMPALLDHKTPIGVIKEAALGNDIRIGGDLFSDVNAEAKRVVDHADRGMPWQQSVYIKPGRVEQIKAGDSVDLNGRKFQGPLAVFRNNRVREVSFCALGADHQTSAQIFIGGERAAPTEDSSMDQISKADHDRELAELQGKFEAEKTRADEEKARADGLQAKFAAEAKDRRVADVKQLFADCGREFKDDVAKAYVEMADEAFTVTASDMRVLAKARDPNLFREQAKQGVHMDDQLDSVEKITAAAQQFVAEQAKVGREVSVSDAVRFVTHRAAA